MDERIALALRSTIEDPDLRARVEETLEAVGFDQPDDTGDGAAFSELDAAVAEHEGVEVLADLAGVPIRIRPVSPGQMLRFTAALGGSDADAGVGMGRLMRIVIHEEDQEKAWDAIDAAGWTIERSVEWVQAQVEVTTGRPFAPQSPSRAQRRHPGPSSNGDSTPQTR